MPSAGITLAIIILIGAGGVIIGYLATEEHRRLDDSEGTPEWTYAETEEGETPYGPAFWGEAFPDCYGESQSPINLSQSQHVVKNANEYELEFHPTECASTELVFSPGDHQWAVDFADCEDRPSLTFDGDHYELLNVHIHSLSEHENGGSLRDAEIHMVHVREGTSDDLLVVGVLMDVGTYGVNSKLTNLWMILDQGQEEVTDADEDFVSAPYDLLPAGPEYSHYMGSLTTPPCTEGVKWIVMTDITMLSLAQLVTFRRAMGEHDMVSAEGHTNRPVQPLNGREVVYVTSA
ncbi:unnamed protein product [Ascophyllum nodosum]